jgi:hypothetical protein
MRLHIVIQEQDDPAASDGGAQIPRRSRSSVLLLEHRQGEWRLQGAERVCRAIGGSVHSNDDLERICIILTAKRTHGPKHEFPALVGGNDDTEVRAV